MPNQKLALEWLVFAQRNLETAQLLIRENHYTDVIAFDIQQATEKALKEHGDKVPQDERLKIEQALNDLREAVKTDDTERIKKAKDAALEAGQKLGEIIYKEAQAKAQAAQGASSQASGQQPQGEAKKDDVVEAEVVDGK